MQRSFAVAQKAITTRLLSSLRRGFAANMFAEEDRVYIALGSNLGQKAANLKQAVARVGGLAGTKVLATSHIVSSDPYYFTDQPKFYNAVIRVRTSLDPFELLAQLKTIEQEMGRVSSLRNRPRLIDLDLLLYGDKVIDHQDGPFPLTVPHLRLQERSFVLEPLAVLFALRDYEALLSAGSGTETRPPGCALAGWVHPVSSKSISDLHAQGPKDLLTRITPVGQEGSDDLVWGTRVRIMSIINITPDSFSDGGRFLQTDAEDDLGIAPEPQLLRPLAPGVRRAVLAALQQVRDGASIVDVGGQSTRPGATLVSAEEEESRVLPVVEALRRQLDALPIATSEGHQRPLISIDTFWARVAANAVAAGAHIVNDISGGMLDPEMFATVAKLDVPYVLTHIRGTPQTMLTPAVLQSYSHEDKLLYEELSSSCSNLPPPPTTIPTLNILSMDNQQMAEMLAGIEVDLVRRVLAATKGGIPLWNILVDPGIGFGKPGACNHALVRSPRHSLLCRYLPTVVGSSRKKFMWKTISAAAARRGATLAAETDHSIPASCDTASAVAVALSTLGGADVVRVHNVPATQQALSMVEEFK